MDSGQRQRRAKSLWLTEWLASALSIRPGMRVLDLGCGRAASSIFLRREFGVQVWATDLWFSASENNERVRDAGVQDGVYSIQADARSLPFPSEFLDAVVSLDSFCYYGTDDLYLNYLARFVRPGADRDCRRGTDQGNRGVRSRTSFPVVDPGSLEFAFGVVVEATLGTNGDHGNRCGRHHARWLATMAGLAPCDRS